MAKKVSVKSGKGKVVAQVKKFDWSKVVKNPDLNKKVVEPETLKGEQVFAFMFCAGGRGTPKLNVKINGREVPHTVGKSYDYSLDAFDNLPKSIAKIFAEIFPLYAGRFPLCFGSKNYSGGGLQIGLNANNSPTWGNVFGYQDQTLFFTTTSGLIGSTDELLAKAVKAELPKPKSKATWAGWKYPTGIDHNIMVEFAKSILGQPRPLSIKGN